MKKDVYFCTIAFFNRITKQITMEKCFRLLCPALQPFLRFFRVPFPESIECRPGQILATSLLIIMGNMTAANEAKRRGDGRDPKLHFSPKQMQCVSLPTLAHLSLQPSGTSLRLFRRLFPASLILSQSSFLPHRNVVCPNSLVDRKQIFFLHLHHFPLLSQLPLPSSAPSSYLETPLVPFWILSLSNFSAVNKPLQHLKGEDSTSSKSMKTKTIKKGRKFIFG